MPQFVMDYELNRAVVNNGYSSHKPLKERFKVMDGTIFQLKISSRIILLVVVGIIGFGINTYISLTTLKSTMIEQRQVMTKSLVEAAHGVLAYYYELVQKGELKEDVAQDSAKKAIKKLRYKGNEYFWLNDYSARVIMHSVKPSLDGKDLNGLKDANGKFIFRSFVDVVNKKGEGYVDYLWPKPGHDEPIEKISYVKGFQPWQWIVGSGLYLDDVNELYIEEVKRQMLIGSGVLGIIMVIATYLVLAIRNRFGTAVKAIHQVAEGEGDLNQRLSEDGSDEIADLCAGFNKFTDKIRNIVVNVTHTTFDLSGSVAKLSQISEETNHGVLRQQKETNELADAIQKVLSTVQEVTDNARSATDASIQAEERASQGRAVVAENTKAIQILEKEVSEATQVIHQLEEESESIGAILEVIRGIADQTNLLALNAAIEAARAGEQGRGFAVVADEVRTLAQRTQESTEEIHDLIGRLQGGARKAAQVMDSGRAQAEAGVQQAAKVGDSLQGISESISIINEMNNQIALAAERQATVTADIGSNVSHIAEIAEDTSHGALNTEKAGGELGNLISKLQDFVMQFKMGEKTLDLSAAKAAHLAWKARLRAFLDGEATLTVDQAVSHHHCAFGKWYYSEGLQNYGHVAELKRVEKPHEKLHQIIKQILEEKQAGNLNQAELLFRQVEPISSEIVGLLDKVEMTVNAGEV